MEIVPAPQKTSPPLPILPVSAVLPALAACLDEGRNAVLVAPPGAGKTTLAPLHLLASPWCETGRLIVVEPRRVAVRAAAHRMADLLGEPIGQTIGYRTRTDSAVSKNTRIEVVTEGLLLRRLIGDPMLDGIAGILFDEVHERSLDLDTALAFALDAQRMVRPDLRLVAMSATTDGAAFSTLLEADLIESEGRQHPIEIRHAKRDLTHQRDLPEACARAILEALATEQGDILAFLPGTGEIRRAQAALAKAPALILPLYGELSTPEQDRALRPAPNGQRRVVLATSIAETSLTVPGVRIVVDGGWRRSPQLDPNTGLSKLQTLRISRATATQRAGRAGREAPGIAIRLWTEASQRGLALHDTPEILNAELTGHCLDTTAWQDATGTDPATLPLLTPAPNGATQAALALLRDLGALTDENAITPLGRDIALLGAHPRLGAMMCAARNPAQRSTAAALAALLEERDPIRTPRGPGNPPAPADIATRLDLLQGRDHPHADRAALARIRQGVTRYRQRLNTRADMDAAAAPALLAAAFPDRIAMARGERGRFRLANGGAARLPANDTLATKTLLAVATLYVRTATEICLAAPLDPENLPETLLARTKQQVETTLDPTTGAVIARQRLRLGALVLRDRNVTLNTEDAPTVLMAQIKANPASTLTWTDATRQFQAKLNHARTSFPNLPDFSDETLTNTLEDWLAPYLPGLTKLSETRALDLLDILRNRMDYTTLAQLDRALPTHIDLPGGRTTIDYTTPIPTIAARAQHFYGLTETPKLAEGRIPLQCALLSPAGRPQAITADLANFWTGGWIDMRKDMRGRYPRHDWPENPATASPHRKR